MARPQTRWIDRRKNRLRFDPWHLGVADHCIHGVFACPYRDGTPEFQRYTTGHYYALSHGRFGAWCRSIPVWLRRHPARCPPEGLRKQWDDSQPGGAPTPPAAPRPASMPQGWVIYSTAKRR